MTPAGKAKYDPKRSGIVWKIKRFNGRQEHAVHATVALITTTRERQPWAHPPLQMHFQVCAGASDPNRLLDARCKDTRIKLAVIVTFSTHRTCIKLFPFRIRIAPADQIWIYPEPVFRHPHATC